MGATTDSGRIRPGNEDNVLADTRVFAVADGMGGHRAGEVASALAVDLLRSRLSAVGADVGGRRRRDRRGQPGDLPRRHRQP